MQSVEERKKKLKSLRDKKAKAKGKTIEEEQVLVVPENDTNADNENLKDTQIIEKPNEEQENNDIEEPLHIAPKKPNWDLKRDVDKRLKKLERRTQRAIVDLLRERLEREKQETSSESESGTEEEED